MEWNLLERKIDLCRKNLGKTGIVTVVVFVLFILLVIGYAILSVMSDSNLMNLIGFFICLSVGFVFFGLQYRDGQKYESKTHMNFCRLYSSKQLTFKDCQIILDYFQAKERINNFQDFSMYSKYYYAFILPVVIAVCLHWAINGTIRNFNPLTFILLSVLSFCFIPPIHYCVKSLFKLKSYREEEIMFHLKLLLLLQK